MRSAIIVLASLFLAAPAAWAESDACGVLDGLPKIEQARKTGYEKTDESCTYHYQILQLPEQAIEKLAGNMEAAGWRISKRRTGTAMGFASAEFTAVRKGWSVHANAFEGLGMRMLELEARRSAGMYEETPQEEAASDEARSILEQASKQLPIPEGARKFSEEWNNRSLTLIYQYAGPLDAAVDWLEAQLKKSGWDVTAREFNQMSGVTTGRLHALKDKLELEITLGAAMMFETVTYELQIRD